MLERVGGWTRRKDKGHMITCAHGGWWGGVGVSREHDCGSHYQRIPKCLRPSVCNWACFLFFVFF